MKTFIRNFSLSAAAAMLIGLVASCEKDNGGKADDGTNSDEEYKAVLGVYISSTIIPTYKSLAEAALEMRAANEALKSNPTDASMKAATDAWMKARIAWELSEAFLFGPVGDQALDIDGHIDSWPLELEEIQAVLKNGALGLTGEKAWAELDPEVIGFHVTEYLLYREGKTRPVKDLTKAELDYLTAATDALVWDCVLAYVAWVGEGSVSEEMKAVFNENPDVVKHLKDNPAYNDFAKKLAPKSENGNYSSWGDALSEIAVGAAEIAGEVGATKILEPYNKKKVEDVESWYSWHSLNDYTNNIRSIKNAYLGGMGDDSRKSTCLSACLARVNPQLDKDIIAKIEECLTKIPAMGKGGFSFYEVVRDQINRTEVEAASTACEELQRLFDKVPEILD